MISVESRPVRMSAEQWNQPGDCMELGVKSYRLGTEVRYGIHSLENGFQRVRPGDWIVVGNGKAQVFGATEFNHKFKIVEQEAGDANE